MTWAEYLMSLSPGDVLLFATATTGVHHDSDLLAVSYCKINEAGESSYGTIFQALPEERAMQGIEYHKIDFNTLSTIGREKDDFEKAVSELFKDTAAYSYNPFFQNLALTEMSDCEIGYVSDLASIVSRAVNQRMMSAEELDKITNLFQFGAFLSKMGKAPPFKRVMQMCNITTDLYSGELPVVMNVQVLHAFWEQLAQLELLTY